MCEIYMYVMKLENCIISYRYFILILLFNIVINRYIIIIIIYILVCCIKINKK